MSTATSWIKTLALTCGLLLSPLAGADEPAKSEPKNDKKTETLADRAISGKARRVAFLNYGPPASWNGSVGDMVGVTISAQAFRDTIKMMRDDKVDVVVIDINSGGGYTLEMERLQKVFNDELETNFRTVGWINWAGSAAAMSPWVLNEIYFRPNGAYGGNVEFSGGTATTGYALQVRLAGMEDASRKGGRDFRIMRSMQAFEPLSATRKADGSIEYFQDYTSGEIKINPPGQVLTLQAIQAVQIGVAAGIAATREELMDRMGITEYEWAGEKASKFMDEFMRKAHRADKYNIEQATKYITAVQMARRLRGPENRQDRGRELGVARRALADLKKAVSLNENFQFHLAGYFRDELTPKWFDEQERMLKELAKDD
jgi:hypothetical protein